MTFYGFFLLSGFLWSPNRIRKFLFWAIFVLSDVLYGLLRREIEVINGLVDFFTFCGWMIEEGGMMLEAEMC